MIQMMKKPVSIFLAVLMIFSCFSGMSLTALAAYEVSENISLVASDSSNLKTISGSSNYQMSKCDNCFNLYYYTITSKVNNNKKLMKIISKIIYSKFFLGKNKKEENI